ncbi:MAG: isoprenylcysteine carboxylmethyltransferase family protein [bacterium]|nr:isoprenylcysteine carboxylmethyltransferase family protein [bacterium]
MTRKSNYLKPAVWGFYIVVVLEFLFMISPFALHFYSAYGPALNVLHASPATSWLTGFFLPHFSTTASPVLNQLREVGLFVAAIGLALFLIGAVQVYGSKLLRRGAVTGGLYRWVRHPQYLALAVLGLGVVLVWPRFLVLLSYLAMLFLYYLLARWEEERCLARCGDSYRDYLRRTGRILPRLPGRAPAVPQPLEARRLVVWLAITLLAGLGLAQALRIYSLGQVSSLYTETTAVLSPAVLPAEELEAAYQVALTNAELTERLAAAGLDARFVAYVVPIDWFLPDLPLHTEQEIREVGGGHRTGAFERGRYKILFTRARLHSGATGRAIVTGAYGRDPVLIVRVDTESKSVLGTSEPPDHVIWGDIPTPMI